MCTQYLSYDPNYNYDDDEDGEDMEVDEEDDDDVEDDYRYYPACKAILNTIDLLVGN